MSIKSVKFLVHIVNIGVALGFEGHQQSGHNLLTQNCRSLSLLGEDRNVQVLLLF